MKLSIVYLCLICLYMEIDCENSTLGSFQWKYNSEVPESKRSICMCTISFHGYL